MEMIEIIDKVIAYGPLGLIALAMGWYILFKDKRHSVLEQQMIDVVEKNAKSITENTGAIQTLTMFIKNGKH